MAKIVPDAEGAVSRAQIVEAMSALDLDATKLYEVYVTTDQVKVREAVFDENGHAVVEGGRVKTHTYTLSIEEDN